MTTDKEALIAKLKSYADRDWAWLNIQDAEFSGLLAQAIEALARPSRAALTAEAIDVGAQRLASFQDNSVWPDSWPYMDVMLMRRQAENVIRSALVEMCVEFEDCSPGTLAAVARTSPEAKESDPIAAAERAVGAWVYNRVSALMGAKPGTADSAELEWLTAMVDDVEEYGATGDHAPPVPFPPEAGE